MEQIRLSSISANPANPRKIFNQKSLNELADSIASVGIIQPLVVRKVGKGYQLLAGERRWRAAQIAGLKTVPVTIREATDEQALEIMLLENMQREDVHPLEEGNGFKSLRDINGMRIRDIAGRVGKSEDYILDRIRLTLLIPELQQAFMDDKMNITTAVCASKLSTDAQKLFLKEVGSRNNMNYSSSYFEKFRGDLRKVNWDKKKVDIFPGAPACSVCQFNTATHEMFPDEVRKPHCQNIKCFERKSRAGLLAELEKCRENGTPVAIADYYRAQIESDLKGLQVLDRYSLDELRDTFQSFKDFCEWELEESDYETKEDYKKAQDEIRVKYEQEKQKWKEAKKGGEYKSMLFIEADLVSYSYRRAKLPNKAKGDRSDKPNISASEIKSKIKEGSEMSAGEILNAKASLQYDILSLNELVMEKIFEAAHQAVGDNYQWDNTSMSPQTVILTVIGLISAIGEYSAEEPIRSVLGWTAEAWEGWRAMEDQEQIYVLNQAIADDGYRMILALSVFLAHQKIKPANGARSYNAGPKAQRYVEFAETVLPEDLKAAKATIEAKYEKKRANLVDLLRQLQE